MTIIEKYWNVKHDLVHDVVLKSTTVVGGQGGGKTELVKALQYDIMEAYENQYNVMNIMTRDIMDIFRLHLPEYEDIFEKVTENDIVNIFIDDALTSAHSLLRKRQSDVNWATVRHYFRALLSGDDPMHPPLYYNGKKGLTLNVFFATQRYQLLAPFEREGSSVFIAKGVDLNPMNAKDNIFEAFLGEEAMGWLKENSSKIDFGADLEDYGEYVLKPKSLPPLFGTFEMAPKMRYEDMWSKNGNGTAEHTKEERRGVEI